jgi:hypothetical protein
LRLGQDVKAFPNFKSFEHAITLVVEIAKQNSNSRTALAILYDLCRRPISMPFAAPFATSDAPHMMAIGA